MMSYDNIHWKWSLGRIFSDMGKWLYYDKEKKSRKHNSYDLMHKMISTMKVRTEAYTKTLGSD